MVSITKSADKVEYYREKDPAYLINGFTFTENIGSCGAFTYTCTNQDNTPFDTSVFTFDPAAPSVTVQTNDLAKVGQYDLKVIGTLGAWGSAEILLTVHV